MALGQLQIPLYSKAPWSRLQYTVTGGPFHDCPPTMVGVKMAREIRKTCAVDIPTDDFQVPSRRDLTQGLEQAVGYLVKGQPLYVGCMGGKGRTGLFLAVLCKAFGIPDPVGYVRKHYYRHAVETEAQYAFVEAFSISEKTRTQIRRARRWTWLRALRRQWALTKAV